MTREQFRILYREFLFRAVDLELISPEGDISKLLGQFASLLVFVSLLFSFMGMALGASSATREQMLISAWRGEHLLIATTMLVVGIFAVLSWDSTFPDRRDVEVLGPLPIRPSTLFAAKVAAAGSALAVAVAAINALTGIVVPLALAPPAINLVDLILAPGLWRTFGAYWLTMFAAGVFIYCSMLGIQGLAAQLPRRWFLRISAVLQIAAFATFICVYFLQPSLSTPGALAAAENQHALRLLPSYWFLALFQFLNGSMHPAMEPLVRRAAVGLALAVFVTATAYLLSYLRTIRRIVDEPDIVASRRAHWSPSFGNPLTSAIVQFSARTLRRSRRHRVMLAFYLGAAWGVTMFLTRAGVGGAVHSIQEARTGLLFSSFITTTIAIIGTRMVFTLPLELRANWIFRLTEIRPTSQYMAAIRRPLFILAVAPVWLTWTVIFFIEWPWWPAAEHLVILGLWCALVAYIILAGFQKIPFTCSYLPGKSVFHMAFLAGILTLVLIARGVAFERYALDDPQFYWGLVTGFITAVLLARWRTLASTSADEALVQYEDAEEPALTGLGLHRDGVMPVGLEHSR